MATFNLCASCADIIYDQFVNDFNMFCKTNNHDEQAILFIKMSFLKALSFLRQDRPDSGPSISPAAEFFTHIGKEGKFAIKRQPIDPLNSEQKRKVFQDFSDRRLTYDVFRHGIEGRKRITYRLRTGDTIITEKKIHGEEVLLPYNISSETFLWKTRDFHNIARSVTLRDLKKAETLQVDDTLILFNNASPAEFSHYTVNLMIEYLNNYSSVREVLARLEEKFDTSSGGQLCADCRRQLGELGQNRVTSYESECQPYHSIFPSFDIILYHYFSRAKSLSTKELDGLVKAAGEMSELQICRGCMEKGVIPGDEECFQ